MAAGSADPDTALATQVLLEDIKECMQAHAQGGARGGKPDGPAFRPNGTGGFQVDLEAAWSDFRIVIGDESL